MIVESPRERDNKRTWWGCEHQYYKLGMLTAYRKSAHQYLRGPRRRQRGGAYSVPATNSISTHTTATNKTQPAPTSTTSTFPGAAVTPGATPPRFTHLYQTSKQAAASAAATATYTRRGTHASSSIATGGHSLVAGCGRASPPVDTTTMPTPSSSSHSKRTASDRDTVAAYPCNCSSVGGAMPLIARGDYGGGGAGAWRSSVAGCAVTVR